MNEQNCHWNERLELKPLSNLIFKLSLLLQANKWATAYLILLYKSVFFFQHKRTDTWNELSETNPSRKTLINF